jgi:hypothetical protein
LAVDVTALPAVLAPLTVVSFALARVPLVFDDFDVLRPEDPRELVVPRGAPRAPPFRERRVLGRDLAAGRRFAAEFRAFDRLVFELRPDFLFVC